MSLRSKLDYFFFSNKNMFPSWAYGLDKEREGRQFWVQTKQGLRLDLPLLSRDGKGEIPFGEHIEMSGLDLSAIVSYGVDETGALRLHRHITWPALRVYPNDTSGSFAYGIPQNLEAEIHLDGQSISPLKPSSFHLDPALSMEGRVSDKLSFKRRIFPHPSDPVLSERFEFTNNTARSQKLSVDYKGLRYVNPEKKGVYGAYLVEAESSFQGDYDLGPGETFVFYLSYSARKVENGDDIKAQWSSPEDAFMERQKFLDEMDEGMVLECPDPVLNQMFRFAKVRLSESIYRTKRGLMHGPGGGTYYAACWTNDQCEYANPFFPFTGYDKGIEQSLNGFRIFSEYMDPDYKKAVVSSIIAEGTDFWNGAGDRGDGAMYAYGASRFVLALGDAETARSLWPHILWSLEFSRRMKDGNGIVHSDSDELENRFPSGNANLSTNFLYHDALQSAAYLADELGESGKAEAFRKEADELARNIEAYFGAEVEGYHTYRYHKDNTRLRSWICLPLISGIMKRKDETIRALFSDRLWTDEGLLSVSPPRRFWSWRKFDRKEMLNILLSSSRTFWDRATLYAMRAAFVGGAVDQALMKLQEFSKSRFMGAHVPYAVEAFPEGNRKHLSAENALYCRVFSEGIFGIRPSGFRSFILTPQIPSSWPSVSLKKIRAFASVFDLEIKRDQSDAGRLIISLTDGNGKKSEFECRNGSSMEINFEKL